MAFAACALVVGALSAPAGKDPCLQATSVILISGTALVVHGCGRLEPSPFGGSERWWRFTADDRQADYLVREDEVIALTLQPAP
jgi:hypothetical protein